MFKSYSVHVPLYANQTEPLYFYSLLIRVAKRDEIRYSQKFEKKSKRSGENITKGSPINLVSLPYPYRLLPPSEILFRAWLVLLFDSNMGFTPFCFTNSNLIISILRDFYCRFYAATKKKYWSGHRSFSVKEEKRQLACNKFINRDIIILVKSGK